MIKHFSKIVIFFYHLPIVKYVITNINQAIIFCKSKNLYSTNT